MESEIERLPLEHPLPEEIQSMEKEDTVCQFCGVSYFIHREVKLLEEKVKVIELELQQYKDYKERFEQAELEIIRLRETEGRLKDELKTRDSRLDKLSLTVTAKEEIVVQKQEELDELNKDYTRASQINARLRKRMKYLEDELSKVRPAFQEQRTSLGAVRAEVQQMISEYSEALQQAAEVVDEMQRKFKDEIGGYQQRIEDLTELNRDLERQCAESMQKAESSQSYLMNIQQLQREIHGLRAREEDYRKKAAEAESSSEKFQEKQRSTLAESAQLKHLLQNKSHEVEEVTTQLKRKDKISQDLIAKLKLEIGQKAKELGMAEAERDELRQALDERLRQGDQLEQQARVSTDEVDGMRQVVARVTEECSDLRKEREMMVHSHQTRIEQLKENFKKKLAEADSWPAKMDDILKQEKNRHSAALAELEQSLREAFQVELEIEKQKSGEITKKERNSLSSAESKFRADLERVSSKHREETGRLKKKFEEQHRNFINVERTLKDEVESLKAVIADLENRLGELHSSQDDASRNLKAELREAEDDLVTSKNESQRLQEVVEKAREEVLVLQETVRRECEERLELTDALGIAKEQLLKLQKENSILSKSQTAPPKPANGDPFSSPSNSPSLPSPCPPSARHTRSRTLQSPSSDTPRSAKLLGPLSGNTQPRSKSSNLAEKPKSELQSDAPFIGSDSTPTFTVQSNSGRRAKKGGNRRKIAPADKKR